MTFWNNWTITVLTWVGAYAAYHFGFVDYLLETDSTYLTFGIFGIFQLANGYLLFKSWQVKDGMYFESDRYGPLWFTSDALLSLGMVGTLIGFITVLSTAFGSVDTSDPEQLRMVLAILATGMGTALTTTLLGLLTSLILKTQLVHLEEANAKAKNDAEV